MNVSEFRKFKIHKMRSTLLHNDGSAVVRNENFGLPAFQIHPTQKNDFYLVKRIYQHKKYIFKCKNMVTSEILEFYRAVRQMMTFFNQLGDSLLFGSSDE
ncbi:hypothetical protein RF11_10441 [Thelohanellus kitauei]|uniref:Uncharacterized protein n=1 Tax=Thelohanellus kitauei TaxID=669202 RepID=A0A0C2JZR4_THEKT|nr:hypothetical protein RF11_10441 [Thelohanellus kitauei]